MNNKSVLAVLGLAAVLGASPSAMAQRSSGAENSLIGIRLYDPGLRVISIYGTPDQILAVGGGGGAIGPAGGGGGGAPTAPGGGRGAPMGGGSPGPLPPPPSGSSSFSVPGEFGFENSILQRGGIAPGEDGPPTGRGAPMGGGAPAAPGGGGGGGGAVGGGGNSGRILFTRWVYNRSGTKLGFVLDKSNRVVQIEAIGLTNPRVRTSRGIGFGSTFAQLIRKYNAPDGYEINGDNVVVRFLVKNKVAFRLSRLGPNKPQVVTGIVVAAGKT